MLKLLLFQIHNLFNSGPKLSVLNTVANNSPVNRLVMSLVEGNETQKKKGCTFRFSVWFRVDCLVISFTPEGCEAY